MKLIGKNQQGVIIELSYEELKQVGEKVYRDQPYFDSEMERRITSVEFLNKIQLILASPLLIEDIQNLSSILRDKLEKIDDSCRILLDKEIEINGR